MKKGTNIILFICIIVLIVLLIASWFTQKIIFNDYKEHREQLIRDEARLEELKKTRAETPPSITGSLPICHSNVYNCADFKSQVDAQITMRYCWEIVGSDIHYLDGDGDGIACESLP